MLPVPVGDVVPLFRPDEPFRVRLVRLGSGVRPSHTRLRSRVGQ